MEVFPHRNKRAVQFRLLAWYYILISVIQIAVMLEETIGANTDKIIITEYDNKRLTYIVHDTANDIHIISHTLNTTK